MPTIEQYSDVRTKLRAARSAILGVLVEEPDDLETQQAYQMTQTALATWERNLPEEQP